MSKKQLLLAMSIFLVLLIVLLLVNRKEEANWVKGEFANKTPLIPSLDVNKIAKIAIYDNNNNVELALQDDKWLVFNRNNYPANFAKIRNFILEINNLKIAQKLSINDTLLEDINLLAPKKDSNNKHTNYKSNSQYNLDSERQKIKEASSLAKQGGTLIEFYDIEGNSILSLILGSFHYEKQDEANTLVEPDKNGRYVRVLGSDPVLTSTTLESLSPVPTQWLDTKIVKLSPLKSLTRLSAKNKEMWKIFRKSPKSPYVFENLKTAEIPDPRKMYFASSIIENLKFIDVIPFNDKKWSFKNAITFVVTLFNDLKCEIKLIKKDKKIFAKFATFSMLPEKRIVAKNETTEDKVKLDTDFAKRVEEVKKELRNNTFFTKWVYELSAKDLENLLLQKDDFILKQQTVPNML